MLTYYDYCKLLDTLVLYLPIIWLEVRGDNERLGKVVH